MPVPCFRIRTLMIAVAVVGALIAAERFRQRSQYYRKQAALCAYFERQQLWYVKNATVDPWPDDGFDYRQGNLDAASEFRTLGERYRRISRHPWESLPPGTPSAVNPCDLVFLSAPEIEEMVEHFDDP